MIGDRLNNYLDYWNKHKEKKPWYWDKIPVEKYLVSGIYCIKIDDVVVYIGKSVNVHSRICNHMYNIEKNTQENKYNILRYFSKEGHKISFDLILTEPDEAMLEIIEKEIIERDRPILNSTYNSKLGRGISIGNVEKYIKDNTPSPLLD